MSESNQQSTSQILKKRAKQNNRGFFRRLIKFLFWTALLGILIVAASAVGIYYYLSKDLPKITSLADYRPPIITSVYANDGQKIAEFYKERRIVIPLTDMPDMLKKAFIAAEDARFYSHSGIDTDALKEVMEYNLSKNRFVYGGSTISQQTIKNIFLTPSRNPMRKWHEFTLTIGMERNISKKRILSLYLNIAEFGRGIYGVNAAAQHYWGIPASELSTNQAVELAATLPAPVKHNPETRTKFFLKRVRKIGRYF